MVSRALRRQMEAVHAKQEELQDFKDEEPSPHFGDKYVTME